MKLLKYVPEACQGEDKKFDGSVEIILPTFDQKYSYLEEYAEFASGEDPTKEVEDDKLTLEEKKKRNLLRIKQIRDIVRISKPHYHSVSIVKLSDGTKYESFDDLSYDDDAHAILIEIAPKLLSGFSLGKPKGQPS